MSRDRRGRAGMGGAVVAALLMAGGCGTGCGGEGIEGRWVGWCEARDEPGDVMAWALDLTVSADDGEAVSGTMLDLPIYEELEDGESAEPAPLEVEGTWEGDTVTLTYTQTGSRVYPDATIVYRTDYTIEGSLDGDRFTGRCVRASEAHYDGEPPGEPYLYAGEFIMLRAE